MKIEANPRIYGYNIYCDTDSEYHAIQSLRGSDIDPKHLMKCYLNSIYGKAVMNMNKDYIVVHEQIEKDDIRVGIIFKSTISTVFKDGDGKARITLNSGYHQYVTESYEDIVKQLV